MVSVRKDVILFIVRHGTNNQKKHTDPTVSDQVGSVPDSHMKLPTKAQMAEMNSVAGINADVASSTGLTKIP